ncbi:hypothetical protein [Streptomyces sp. NPDC059874]|uniref:hypothetical protein n=1 Tax=Streptomyces sp. NPDC059874 TaxID=3346983 RepID=UPI003646F00E
MGEILRLERTRNYLEAGDVVLALDRWRQFLRCPDSREWDACEWGSVHWHCCGSPLVGRVLLDAVMQALSPRSARELRTFIDRYDADARAIAPALALATHLSRLSEVRAVSVKLD